MESMVDLTFWEIFFVAFKVIPAWLLATASWVLGLVLATLFATGIVALVVMTWDCFFKK